MEDNLEKLKSALSKTSPEKFKEKESNLDENKTEDIDWNKIILNQNTTIDIGNTYPSVYNGGYITINSSSTGPSGSNYTTTYPPPGANGAAGNYGLNWPNLNDRSLKVNGNAEFYGDILWKGRSLGDLLTTIESRLAILVPDPKKLEQFEALKKAYDHYKTLEALCQISDKQEEK
jgi:hypothetical protein